MNKNILFCIIILAFIFLFSCSTINIIKEKTINVGCILPLSGDLAEFGQMAKEGIDLAYNLYLKNKDNNSIKIKLIYMDDKADPQIAEAKCNELIKNYKVSVILGSVTSRCTIQLANICEENKILLITPTSTNPAVTLNNDYVFRACFIDPFQGNIAAKFILKYLKKTEAICIYNYYNLYSKKISENFKYEFSKLGGNLLSYSGYDEKILEDDNFYKKILLPNPEVIFIPDYYDNAGKIIKRLREIGYKGTFIGSDGWDSLEFFSYAENNAFNSFFVNHYSYKDPRKINQLFVKNFTDFYGKPPSQISALGYDTFMLFFNALKIANNIDPTIIKESLKKIDIELATGNIKFDENGDPIKSGVIMVVKENDFDYYMTINP